MNFKNGIILRAINAFENAIGNFDYNLDADMKQDLMSLKSTCYRIITHSKKENANGNIGYLTSFET